MIRESIAVKARQSFRRTEPQKAARIRRNAENGVVRQPVGGRVPAVRKLRSVKGPTEREQCQLQYPAMFENAHVGPYYKEEDPRSGKRGRLSQTGELGRRIQLGHAIKPLGDFGSTGQYLDHGQFQRDTAEG